MSGAHWMADVTADEDYMESLGRTRRPVETEWNSARHVVTIDRASRCRRQDDEYVERLRSENFRLAARVDELLDMLDALRSRDNGDTARLTEAIEAVYAEPPGTSLSRLKINLIRRSGVRMSWPGVVE